MFSCCRCASNPKKDGKITKKDKQKPATDPPKDNKDAEIEKPPELDGSTTIDNAEAQATSLPNDNEKQLQSENEAKDPTTNNVANSESIIKNNNPTEAVAPPPTEADSEVSSASTTTKTSPQYSGDREPNQQLKEKVDSTVPSANDTDPQDDNDHVSSTTNCTSPNVPTNCDSGDSTITSSNLLEHSPLNNESSSSSPPLPSAATAATTTEGPIKSSGDLSDFARSPLPTTTSTSTTATTATTINEVRPKSCLSRHNSTRSSIKKRVNINNSTEIIATPDLPSIDDDEVFSDSIPPQKRENMCAPYVENGGDGLQGRFGLPEWFNEERFNDINFMDPPVTPVGRDELELRRHRLYSDLITAAQAAVDGRVLFNQIGSTAPPPQPPEACDPDIKPSVAADLEHLLNRLERLVERLERSVSARELEIANKTLDSVLEKKRNSFDLESTELPPIPTAESEANEQQLKSKNLNERIERIENSLSRLNDSYSKENDNDIDGSLENIPTTVLEEYLPEEDQSPLPPPPPPICESMSVLGYQDIVNGPLSQYLTLSQKIGGDVAAHAKLVKAAFDAQLQYVMLASESAKPTQDKQMQLLKPTSDQISAIQSFREKNRASPFFNHLSAISESIPALGWVCVSPTPGPHVKEMNDAGQFYTNRVLKDWKEKDPTHVEWARAWVQTLTELQQYIKQYHTTGLVWSGKGTAGAVPPPPPSMAGCPPPPPPPAFDLASMSLNDGSADERSALFAEINQGEAITKNLKKVTADMQTHKNPTLRTGPAPFKAPQQFGKSSAPAKVDVVKEPVFTRDGKKWLIEYQKSNPNLIVENAEMNNVVYMFRCENSTLTIKGKVNNVVMDSCKKCSLLFDSVVSSIEFVNCQSVQMQVLGFVPTVSIDKTDGCQMYLSKDSLGVAIISSKSSEMNVSIPMANGDFMEQALPEQFRTTIDGTTLKTVCVDSLG